jgi:hypothetical protein
VQGSDKRPGELFSYLDLEQLMRSDHPIGTLRGLTDGPLRRCRALMCAMLLQARTSRGAATHS